MKKLLFLLLPILFLFLGLAGCEEEVLPMPQHQLKADAGSNQSVTVNTPLSLDGSASRDGSGMPFSFLWTIKSKPAASAALLSNGGTASPSFTPDVAGVYVLELTIRNKLGFHSDEVSITATNSNSGGGGTEAPAGVELSENILSDRVLENIFEDPTKADYRVTASIALTARLVLEPGVVIAFEQDKGLKVEAGGALIAKGTEEEKIIFTGTTKVKGAWKGILFASNSSLNELQHVVVEYGGSSAFAEMPSIDVYANVALLGTSLPGAALKLSNTSLREGAGYGLYVQGMAELNAFSSNSFVNNTAAAAYVPARQLHKLDENSQFSGNNGIEGVQTGGGLKAAAEVAWPGFNDGSAYYVGTDLSIESGLRIAAGATLAFSEGVSMLVMDGGYLHAVGTPSSAVTFTAQNKTAAQYWGGILVNTASNLNKIQYAEISYAGGKALPGFGEIAANLAVGTTGKLTVQNTLLLNGQGWGLLAYTDLGAQVNADVATSNVYEGFSGKEVKLRNSTPNDPVVSLNPLLIGEWVDLYSFNRKLYHIDEKFYDRQANQWFRGASSPWTMNPKTGFGLKIAADGSYIWTMAQYVPSDPGSVSECNGSYSAEYFVGKLSPALNPFAQELRFKESYWRDFFYNACDSSGNVDWEVTPGEVLLKYSIYQESNSAGQQYWVLEFTSPGGETFKHYKL